MKEITDVAEPIETITVTDDNDDFNPIETTSIEDDIDIPSDDGMAIGVPRTVKIIIDPNRLHLASNRIKKNNFGKTQKEY